MSQMAGQRALLDVKYPPAGCRQERFIAPGLMSRLPRGELAEMGDLSGLAVVARPFATALGFCTRINRCQSGSESPDEVSRSLLPFAFFAGIRHKTLALARS